MRKMLIYIFIIIFFVGVLSCTKSLPQHYIKFNTKPCIKPLASYQYTTCGDFRVTVDTNELIIKKGFRTDLASIPKPLWSVISPMQSSYVYPAILHDYLYSGMINITRVDADQIFYDALLFEGASGYTANKMWLAVRLFGKKAFKGYEVN
jgi:hypothetical protein